MIREVYMGPGDFRVSLKVATPHLMADVTRGGYLVITPQHLGDPRNYTEANLLAAARYTGIVLQTIWKDGVLTLEGAGLDWILGDLDGVGWPCPTRNYSNATIGTVIALTTGTGIIPQASFTIGSTITGSNYTGSHSSSETVKEVLMQVMAQIGNHYRIYPDGSIETEATTGTTIYQNPPEIVFVRNNWGSDGLYTGLPVDSLSSSYSIREYLDASGIYFYGLQDAQLQRTDTTSPVTTREILGAEVQMQEIRLPYAQLAATNAAVGDLINVWDPGSGFEGDSKIWFRGQRLAPQRLRVQEVTWPIVEGMGIYYRPGEYGTDSGDWIDLTYTTQRSAVARSQTSLRAWDTNVVEGC